ncbi:MAG: chromosome segregation protein SMC [Thermoplasmata archaeon]|nr:chromosome segregation protein SMC [Thermoplasmata archaeon]
MHLKEVEIENFKSFGKRTRIPILPGYTAITGPNGSGKSNISDAILFVLGPKSSRVIRAGRLTDLIFNGGSSGHRASECKVSLYFDNGDNLIPIDTETVKLTRLVRLSESSEEGYYSYYYVNDKKSSLGEIEELLAHARISADGYNFVQQGDITKIVQMGPVDRRRILDDIAGISRFDDDIVKAEKERLEAEDNISKLNIIIDELRKQMKQLESDRECAMKYRDMRDRLVLSKAQLAAKKRDEVEKELATIQSQIQNYEKEKVQLQETTEKARDEIKHIEQQLSEVEAKIIEKGGDSARQTKEKIDQIRIDLARATDAVQTAEEKLTDLAQQIKITKEEVKKVNKELDQLEEKKKDLSGTIDEKGARLKELKSSLSKKQGEITESDEKLGKMHGDMDQLVKSITSKEDSYRGLVIEQDKFSGKIERLKSEITELEESKKTYEFELKDADWSEKQLATDKKSSAGEVKKLQENYYSKRNEEKKLAKESQELEEAIKSLTREYNRLKAEADAVKMVAEGYTSAVGRIIEARDKSEIKGIHGTVSDICNVDSKYGTAISVSAGNRLQAVIVDSDDVASKCIDILKKSKLGRVTFLPLNKMVEGKSRGKAMLAAKKSLGYAIDLVEFDDKYRAAMWYVFGDTIVVGSMGEARAMMGGIRIVTLEGDLIEASNAMIGGTLEKGGRIGAPSHSKIEKVGSDLRTATEQAEKLNDRLWELKEELTNLEDQLKTASVSDGGQDAKMASIEMKKKEFAQKIATKNSELDAKGKELSESLDSLEDCKENIESIESEITALKKTRDELGEKIQKATPKEIAQALKKVEGEILELTTAVASLSSQRETIAKQIELVEARKSEFETALKSYIDETAANKKKITENKEKTQSLETELNALRKLEESMGAEIEKLRKKRDDLYKQKTDSEAAIDKHQSKMETTHDLIIGLKTKQGAAEIALNELIAELSTYTIDISQQKLPPISELKEIIQKCESEMNSLGIVNLRAIEDYDEKKQRFDTVRTEISQLSKQRTNLIKLVAELNDKKKFGLMRVFESIRENFKRIYADMSGGGEADLILENSEEPLQGGLILRARPRDNKELRLEALSGGEKSLTALSFIFAIQQYEPSPFYLLDEVDMFLDGVNAENVARAIGKNAANAQFLQVSLRKTTLKEADHMIGVTRLATGISQVILKPNIGDEMPEAEDVPEPQEAG